MLRLRHPAIPRSKRSTLPSCSARLLDRVECSSPSTSSTFPRPREVLLTSRKVMPGSTSSIHAPIHARILALSHERSTRFGGRGLYGRRARRRQGGAPAAGRSGWPGSGACLLDHTDGGLLHGATPPQPGKRPHETRNVCARGRQGSGRPALTITRPRPPKDLPFPCQKLLGPANSPPARSRRRGLWHQGRGGGAVRSVEMMRTAQMIVEECVALRPGEQVAVIGDTETVPIAEVLAQAA